MQYWLLKSEPDCYSIDDLERDRTTPWDGIRNAQARNFVRSMQKGDLALIYHSGKERAAVGLSRISAEPRPDPLQFDPDSDKHDATSNPEDPRWWLVDLDFQSRFQHSVTLKTMKTEPELSSMLLFRQGRLSVTPLSPREFEIICQLGDMG